ncbi:MAG: CapA family protein [Chloroflexi bacterium]|nr:CapA family protein [Chloroflexota bacterium]
MTVGRPAGHLVVQLVGDIYVRREEPLSLFVHVAPLLRQGDITIGNLEGPITDRGQPLQGKIQPGQSYYRAAPNVAQVLADVGFDAVSLANNHMMDYGPEGLTQTLELLRQAGIRYAGAGRNVEEAHQPATMEKNGVRLALLSYTSVFLPVEFPAGKDRPGVATAKVQTAYHTPVNALIEPGFPPIIYTIPDPGETDRILDDIRRAKQQADVVIVSWHWGISRGYGQVAGYQKELGRAAIDAGADLIMGHHPHQLQGMEMYKGRLIAYSLNEFGLERAYARPFAGSETVLLKFHIEHRNVKGYSFIPGWIDRATFEPRLVDLDEGRPVIEKMEKMSEEFGTTFTMQGNEMAIGGPRPGTPPAPRGVQALADSLIPAGDIPSRRRSAGSSQQPSGRRD